MAGFSPTQFTFGGRVNERRAMASRERLENAQLQAAAAEKAREQLEEAFKNSESAAQDAFDNGIEVLREASENGASPEQLDQLSEAVMMGPNSHALFVAQLRAQARVAGASDEQLMLIEQPGDIINKSQRVLDSHRQVMEMVGQTNLGTQQFREGENFTTRRTVRGVPDMTDAGIIAISPISQRQEVLNLTPEDLRTDSQLGAATQESVETLEAAQERLITLTQTGSAVAELPRTVGAFGVVNEIVGGSVGQVSPALAAGLSQILTGTDPQRASDIRATSRIIIAENLTNITGEESGRYTEPERQIAEQTIRATPANANAQQILGAFGTLLRIEIAAESRELMRLEKPQRFDLLKSGGETTSIFGSDISIEELDKLDMFLIDAGITSAPVRDGIARYLIATQQTGVVPLR